MELIRTLRYRIRYNPPQRLVLNALKRAGITVLSVVDYYNRPSLSFAGKIGCRRQRLNLHVRLFGLIGISLTLKTYPSTPAHDKEPATA